MNLKLKEKIHESLRAVVPITVIMVIVSTLLVPMEIGTVALFLFGAVLLVIGMGFFQMGAEMAMSPLGEGVGVQLTHTGKRWSVALIGVLMGTIITIAEPDLQVLAEQVPSIPNLAIILTVAVGVGLFLALAIRRIMLRFRLSILLTLLYGALLAMSFLIPENFIAVAFDAGGVTTGPITVPFIMAVGTGLASVRGDKHAADDSFGLVALSSFGPILAVMLLSLFYHPDAAEYALAEVAEIHTMQDVATRFLYELPRYAWEVSVSMVPLLAVFVVFQKVTHRYHSRQLRKTVMGFVYTLIGLVLFLCGVNVGFAPVGAELGGRLAASGYRWMLIPVGMVIGYSIVKAEPAIQVLNRQVHAVTNGSISERAMNLCLSLGVCVSVGLSMLRVLTGLPVRWILIPGYVLALVLSRFMPKIFVGIAFDSGGVASGPMTTTFLLPLSIGACEALGGNLMTDAFGVVAMVAMTPLIAVQIMGLVYRVRLNRAQKQAPLPTLTPEAEDDIIELEEE